MKSRIFILVLILCLLIPSINFAISPKIMIYDFLLDLQVEPITENGRTLVPIDPIFQYLDIDIEWNQKDNTILAIKENKIIKLKVNDKNALVDGKKIKLDVPPKIINNNVLVPARFISENLGADVLWNEKSKTVLINSNEFSSNKIYTYYLNRSDIKDAKKLVKDKSNSEINKWLMKNYILKTDYQFEDRFINTAMFTPYADLVSNISSVGLNENTDLAALYHIKQVDLLKPLTFSIYLGSKDKENFKDIEKTLDAYLYQENLFGPNVQKHKSNLNNINYFEDEDGYYTTATITFYAMDSVGFDFFKPIELNIKHKDIGNIKYTIDLYEYR